MAFKMHVVSEIESGRLSIEGARRKYGIRGSVTVPGWVRKLGKQHLLPKVVRVETPGERDQLKAQAKRIQELEAALSDAHIKLMAYESLINVAEKEYKLDIKKNFGTKRSKACRGSDPSAGGVSGRDD
jgi:transposase-like protein